MDRDKQRTSEKSPNLWILQRMEQRWIQKETLENKVLVIMGDANLCSQQWENKDYTNFNVAVEL